MKISQEKLDEMIERHNVWLKSLADEKLEDKGEKLDLCGIDVSGLSFEGKDISRADMRRCIAEFTNFFKANLYKANLTGAILNSANFARAYCLYTKFSFVSINNTKFTFTYLALAIMEYIDAYNIDFQGATFRKAKINNVKFQKSDFKFIVLRETDSPIINISNTEFSSDCDFRLMSENFKKVFSEQVEGFADKVII